MIARRHTADVGQVRPECAPGRFEISVAAPGPVAAAGRGVPVRRTIRAVTRRHGPRVSFSPVVPARGGRLVEPVLVRHLLWTAVDLGLPLQLHTGFGDDDIRPHRADPARLMDWLHLFAGTIPVLLPHCRPCRRQAACLAAVFEQVYLDVGLTLHHVGPVRARTVLEEALEITPFRKLLYGSDAYGVAGFYRLGAPAFRRGPGDLLQDRVDAGEPGLPDELSLPDALRRARWAGADDARQVYRLPDGLKV